MKFATLGAPMLVWTVSALASGCAALDRESYSLAFSKKEHRYAEPGPRERARAEAEREAAREDPAAVPEWKKALREVLQADAGVDLEPFRPFAYCQRHRSAHVAESILALSAAPLEYPLALSINTGSNFLQRTVEEIGRILGLGPAPPVTPLPPETEGRDPTLPRR